MGKGSCGACSSILGEGREDPFWGLLNKTELMPVLCSWEQNGTGWRSLGDKTPLNAGFGKVGGWYEVAQWALLWLLKSVYLAHASVWTVVDSGEPVGRLMVLKFYKVSSLFILG